MAMDFRDATDDLLMGISHAHLANALGKSVALIRQARLESTAKAHRTPPEGWEKPIARLAKEHAHRLQRLAERLEKQAAK